MNVHNEVIEGLFTSFGRSTWLTIATFIALALAVVGYILFVRPSRKYNNKFVNYVRNFLNFDELVIEPLVKVLYIFVTLYVILSSFSYLDVSFWTFLSYLVGGIVAARLVYEIVMVIVGIYKNTKK